ncbi:Transcriptional regulatory protein KdpE [bacterium HR25]|nr:Transcriptional regulatory protein KdpE [bacterium HR25]
MGSGPLVLVVDDDPGVLRLIKLELTVQGFNVLTSEHPTSALRIVRDERPDVVLLDILMPEMNGFELLRRVREISDVPVILITARDSDSDKVSGLEQGADDYVVKPFSVEELGARIRAVLRRVEGKRQERCLRIGELEIDLDKRQVFRGGEPVHLTRTEWLLLQRLAVHPGRVMTTAELLTKVWGPEYSNDVQYLRVWISRLRQKLERDPSQPRVIKTRQGIGYVLDVEAGPPEEAGRSPPQTKRQRS